MMRFAGSCCAGSAILFASCIFEPGRDAPPRPRTTYDFSRFDTLPNPLARWYPAAGNKCVAGVKFAFRSMEYEKEVDANIAAFAAEAGGKPAAAGAYFDLSSRPGNLKRFLDAVGAHGVIPYVTLDPKDWDEPDLAYQRSFIGLVNEGRFDSSLWAQAEVLREFGKPVLFRFAHEMNGDWYPYSGAFIGGKADADRDGVPDGPQNFVKAWRRVHGLFKEAGADNLLWIYSPNWESFPGEDWNGPFRYYPGSAYVDMISADAYESPDKRLQGLDEVLEEFYNEMGLFLEGKEDDPEFVLRPFGLSEFGTWRTEAAAKGEWYAAALRTIASDGRIRFNVLYNDRNGARDFSIAGLGERLRELYADSRFHLLLPAGVAKR
jgi:hypothetical protein